MTRLISTILLLALSTIAFAETRTEFVDRFMKTQVPGSNVSETEQIKFISRRFIEENNIDPFFMKLDGWGIKEYKIINVEGDYVDLINITGIGMERPFKTHLLRLKVINEGGSWRLVPYGMSGDDVWFDYYWLSLQMVGSTENLTLLK